MSRPPRIEGFSYSGLHRYFLTCCTFNRQTAFLQRATVDLTLLKFLESATENSIAILAYCFMPDHVHLLVHGLNDSSDFLRFVKIAKQRSGAAFALQRGTKLWQEGFFDRVLRDPEKTDAIIRYMLANPVRAGIVKSPSEYPFLGSSVFTLDALLEL